MLSKKLLQRNKTISICLNSEEIKPGDTFRSVRISGDEFDDFIPKNQPIVCCGKVNEEEMLFRTEDGQYYFSLTDGWGAENYTLYGLNVSIFFDFKHPTDPSTIADECKNNLGTYGTWGGAMAYYNRKHTLSTIVQVMRK